MSVPINGRKLNGEFVTNYKFTNLKNTLMFKPKDLVSYKMVAKYINQVECKCYTIESMIRRKWNTCEIKYIPPLIYNIGKAIHR